MMITHKPAHTNLNLNLDWAVKLCPDLIRELNVTLEEGNLFRQTLAESLCGHLDKDDEPTECGPLERQARESQAQGIW